MPSHVTVPAHLANIPAEEVHQLLRAAKSMKESGHLDRPLHGRHVVVLTETRGSASDSLFTAAATALGAAVAHISPKAAGLFDPLRTKETALALGKLYAAAMLDDTGKEQADRLAGGLGIPVFTSVDHDDHPTRLLGNLLTLMEAADRPLPDTTLCVAGSAGVSASATWHALGALVSLKTETGGDRDPCSPLAADFVLAAPAGQPSAPAELWKRERSEGSLHSLHTHQVQNQRYVLQALLRARVAHG